ncbi:uncharacterized protein LOC131240974 [Magnolia sinica]|uniref:uncharacterized protein LOC131240974 n=1 Tax=Magnolia sinica TaxID=86752 RepID=UPI0026584585|nr:uncharacterized protein LOC131240974 [Magnolia sinica]
MDSKIQDRDGMSENSTNPVVLETAIEVKSAESGEDGVPKEIGENSSIPATHETVIEVRSAESRCVASRDGDSKAKIDLLEGSKVENVKASVLDTEKDTCVVVDVKCSEGGLVNGNCDAEKVCRICHLSSECRSDGWDLIQLGCSCKGELGMAHRHCAVAWFKTKGNRCCEICGEVAKNVTGLEDDKFMEDWNDRRTSSIGSSSSRERGRCWRGQPFCNFLMACLVVAFILPWFFRANMF